MPKKHWNLTHSIWNNEQCRTVFLPEKRRSIHNTKLNKREPSTVLFLFWAEFSVLKTSTFTTFASILCLEWTYSNYKRRQAHEH